MAQIDLNSIGVGDALGVILDLFGTEVTITREQNSLDSKASKITQDMLALFQYDKSILKDGRWTKANTILVRKSEDYVPQEGDSGRSELGDFRIGAVFPQGVGSPIGYLCEVVS